MDIESIHPVAGIMSLVIKDFDFIPYSIVAMAYDFDYRFVGELFNVFEDWFVS